MLLYYKNKAREDILGKKGIKKQFFKIEDLAIIQFH